MTHDAYPDGCIRNILRNAKSFAIVGASTNPIRPSYFVVKYLIEKGFHVFPVNTGHAGEQIGSRTVYADLADIPEPIDVVDVFRKPEAAIGIAKEAIAVKAKVLWMQLGVRNDEAARIAEAAGLQVVMNRCPKIEYGRLSGEIGWTGVNSRVLSSKRQVLGRGIQRRSLGIVSTN